jgi:hypothetical protein
LWLRRSRVRAPSVTLLHPIKVILVEVKPHNIDLVAQLWVENTENRAGFR